MTCGVDLRAFFPDRKSKIITMMLTLIRDSTLFLFRDVQGDERRYRSGVNLDFRPVLYYGSPCIKK